MRWGCRGTVLRHRKSQVEARLLHQPPFCCVCLCVCVCVCVCVRVIIEEKVLVDRFLDQ